MLEKLSSLSAKEFWIIKIKFFYLIEDHILLFNPTISISLAISFFLLSSPIHSYFFISIFWSHSSFYYWLHWVGTSLKVAITWSYPMSITHYRCPLCSHKNYTILLLLAHVFRVPYCLQSLSGLSCLTTWMSMILMVKLCLGEEHQQKQSRRWGGWRRSVK